MRPVVLEAGPEPGAAWRARYDRLHLHTPRLLSGLPGYRIPRRYGCQVIDNPRPISSRQKSTIHWRLTMAVRSWKSKFVTPYSRA